jgi:hypothetical protein
MVCKIRTRYSVINVILVFVFQFILKTEDVERFCIVQLSIMFSSMSTDFSHFGKETKIEVRRKLTKNV